METGHIKQKLTDMSIYDRMILKDKNGVNYELSKHSQQKYTIYTGNIFISSRSVASGSINDMINYIQQNGLSITKFGTSPLLANGL